MNEVLSEELDRDYFGQHPAVVADPSGGVKRPLDELHYRFNTMRSNDQLPLDLLAEAFRDAVSEARSGTRLPLSEILHGLMQKGPTRAEIVTLLVEALRFDGNSPFFKNKKKIQGLKPGSPLICAAGSGKKGHKTINISTPAGLVAAAGGVNFLKPCSSSVSSVTGSSDFLSELGIEIRITPEVTEDLVRKHRFGFFRLEGIIPSFDHVYGGYFRAPHALSFALPAIVGPYQPDCLLYGLAHPNVELSAQIFHSLGFPHALVCGTSDDNIHYVDEVGAGGKTWVAGYKSSVVGLARRYDTFDLLGLAPITPKDVAPGEDACQNTKFSLAAILGTGRPAHRDVIAVNAGTIFFLAGLAENLRDGYELALSVIRSGSVAELIRNICVDTGGDLKRCQTLLDQNINARLS